MFSKRIVIAVYDVAFALSIACVILLVCVQPAYAYVDPSVMTYTIQALAGVAVALSAVLGVAWRRTRKKLMHLFNIDENANKEVEPDVHRIDPRDHTVLVEIETEKEVGSKRRAYAKRNPRTVQLSWSRRFVLALVASVFLAYTVGVVAPYEIVAGSADSLIFELTNIWMPLAVFAGVVALVGALVLSALRGRVYNVAIALVVALGTGCYIQAMFLNAALPVADGSAVAWGDYTTITVVSAVVWLAILAVAIVLCLKKANLFRSAAALVSVALIVVQSVGVASLWLSPEPASADAAGATAPENEVHVTEEGLFTVSPKSNVIVFVLDTFDTQNMEDLRKANPAMLDELTGFTYFPDSVGSMIPTRYGVPYLLTGELPQVGDTYSQFFFKGMYDRSTLLDDIHEQGYSIGLYSDSIESTEILTGVDPIAGETLNIHPLGEFLVDNKQVILTLGKCALYRDLPWLLKPPFWFYTDELNNKVTLPGNGDYGDVPYTMNDANYYSMLVSDKLSAIDDDVKGSFRFIHLEGAHGPYIMDENAQVSADATFEEQCYGSFKIVSEYIKQMKELGVYDNATIIVTADHGAWYSTDNLTEPTSPILFVKPATDEGESSAPCQISTVPTGHMDYPATIIDAVGGDSSKYGTTVFEVSDANRTRYYYMTANDWKRDRAIKELAVEGNVLDFNNWRLTGNVWDCDL